MPSSKKVTYTVETCWPCKWLSKHLIKSGRDPVYDIACNHPTTIADDWPAGRDIDLDDNGEIARPDWCPIRGDRDAEKDADGGFFPDAEERRTNANS